ncbi:MAG TPA: hypothetical protein PLK14_05670 [Sediminibacterium sp.]|nr:hypothetical protein [Sediminibacterium sp.]HQS54573.1 hypothetical protein [Sediminibacterium sp.]
MKKWILAIMVILLMTAAAYFGIQWYSNAAKTTTIAPVTVQSIEPEKTRVNYDLSYAIHIEKDSLELHLDNIQMRLHMDSLRPYLETNEAAFHAKPLSLITQKGYSDHCLAKVLDLMSMYQVKDYQLVKQ